MAITIVTKFVGPTNTKGARVSASYDGERVTVAWDHALNPAQNHAAAARKLAEKVVTTVADFRCVADTDTGYIWSNLNADDLAFTVDNTSR